MFRYRLIVSAALLMSSAAVAQTRNGDPTSAFEKNIRPLLSERCVACHGPQKAKAGLRLDTQAGLLKGSENGAVISAENPRASRLLEAVRYEGEVHMPPGGKLTAAEIAVLEQWIQAGAPWPENARLLPPKALTASVTTHWAFRPVLKTAPPATRRQGWACSDVDRYVLAKLEAAGLEPSPEADRRTLIRRATFDLTGLPPTPEEVKTFESDSSPDAYTRLIDRLLASPRYGERWARHWLDLARYADNKGYVFFEDKQYPWAFTYRDYVVEAINRDLPYDRFVQEQLAADLLAPQDAKAQAALGFLTVGGHFMNNTHDIIDDRIDVVCRGLQGLTVTCARCHDHKFDPISQADYYSLYGVFRSCVEPLVPPLVGPAPSTKEYEQYARELGNREKKLHDFVTAKHHELVVGARTQVGEYLLAAHAARQQPPADDFMLLADKGDLNPTMINRWRVYLEGTRKPPHPVWAPWHAFAAIPEGEFAGQADQVQRALRSIAKLNPAVRDAFDKVPADLKDVAARYGKLFVAIENQWQEDRKRADAAKSPAPSRLGDDAAEELRQVLYGPGSPADAPLELDWGFLSLFPDRATQEEYKKLIKAVEEQSAKGPPRAMVLHDSPRPFDPHVFLRGQPQRPGEPVPRQYLPAVKPDRRPFQQGSGRLELAREITSTTNPLTARVLVNRVWMHHFGTGLVATPGDFGLRGNRPSHPELLDRLADDFMESGWSLKQLHRKIMTSAVYRQSSRDRSEAAAVDPENRLLWRFARRRLDFESLHDALLAVSGQLEEKLGGPPVPLLGGSKRRALYQYVDRLDFPSLLTTFDVPNPAGSVPQRTETTVPPQALFLMNGPMARQAAKDLLQRPAVKSETQPNLKLRALYLLVFQRTPTDRERTLAAAYLGSSPDLQRWVDFAHALILTNEFTFVD